MLELSIFTLLSLFLLGGSLTMISQKQTLFSAFGFLVAMLALAGLFALVGSRFLAIAQVMVSVGAVVVLSMLTMLTLNAKEENLPKEPHKFRSMIFSALLVAPITFLIYKALTHLPDYFSTMPTLTSKLIGKELFSSWVLPFEIVSILLLVAMLGAIIIAKEKLKKERR